MTNVEANKVIQILMEESWDLDLAFIRDFVEKIQEMVSVPPKPEPNPTIGPSEMGLTLMRQDQARLDWLDSAKPNIVYYNGAWAIRHHEKPRYYAFGFAYLRAAIDEAMKCKATVDLADEARSGGVYK
jgi:hypothetical protein